VSSGAAAVKAPMLLIACEQDHPPFRAAALEEWRRAFYSHATVVSLTDSGHYPMQETPPLLTTVVERLLAS
jgi:pimeloyl-ACP methyl ester carboxylesterase